MNLDVLGDGSEKIHYQNPEIPIYIGYGKLSVFQNMASLSHWHEDVEFSMPVKGYLNYNVNGEQIKIEEGNAIFVNSRQLHYGFSADGTDCEYICICFKTALLNAYRQLYEKYVLSVVVNTQFPYCVIKRENKEHVRILELICELANCVGKDMRVMGKLHELWQEIYNLTETNQSVFVSGKDIQKLKKMIAWIHLQYTEHISLEQIAKEGRISRNKCCEIFKKYMGHTPNDYVTSFRLEKAGELLTITDGTITEIALSYGFNSASYFTEVFSRKKGCTPKEYREKRREKRNE